VTFSEKPFTLVAELTYRCPLHCPYCSNPLTISDQHYKDELSTEDWARVFREARALGVMQLGLTGGEPMARPDIVELTAAARSAGLYSTLVTAALSFTRARAEALREAGLDHVQVSLQDSRAEASDRMAGTRSFERKLEAARLARELGFPLTMNFVMHRQNLDRIDEILALSEELGAERVELANTQYYGWAMPNRAALMPTREQLERAERIVEEFRRRLGSRMEILYVLPDYYEDLPKTCSGGWGRHAIVVAPSGDAMPCHAATVIPGLEFDNVRAHSLAWIWEESSAFNAFRGTGWMKEPCASCPLGRQEVDYGGCRCQAMLLTGDPTNADPVCRLSPHHDMIVEARDRDSAGNGDAPLVYRTLRPDGVPGPR
jgi:pyrroloquinoline quinone biosynthesis protein E